MLPTKIEMTRGDTEDFVVTFDENGVPCDITGWTVIMTVKADKDDADAQAVVQKIVITHTAPETGVAVIPFEPADTDALEAKGYWFDIQAKTDTGDVYTVLKGIFKLEYDISRRTE